MVNQAGNFHFLSQIGPTEYLKVILAGNLNLILWLPAEASVL